MQTTKQYTLPALPLNAPLNRRAADRLITYSRQVARNRSNAAGILRAATALEQAMSTAGPLHDMVNAMSDEQLDRWDGQVAR